MKRTIPVVHGGILMLHDEGEDRSIVVGTPAWYTWLRTATSFSFAGSQGTFTAFKESRQHDRRYWRAFRKRSGKLFKAYLGKDEALVLERLNEAASVLARPGTIPPEMTDGASPSSSADRAAGTLVASPDSVDIRPGEMPADALLATKLSVPPIRVDLVLRPRLIKQLALGSQRRLTLVSAPPGYGKTTLLVQWSIQNPNPVAWVSLDASDDDPARFWSYVMAALQALHLRLGDQQAAFSRSSELPPIESVLTNLINSVAVTPKDVTLVLDDYHFIQSPAIHAAVAFLIDHLPTQMHLIIASRTDPPLLLARLRSTSQLVELRAADLSFTSDETTTFLSQVMKLNLEAEDAALLEKCTEGWIAGLQMAGLSMQGHENVRQFVKDFGGNNRDVADYLMEEIFSRQPEDIRAFLLQTSILERLNGPICDAVTNQVAGQSQAMLETLEHANLFIVPMDNERRWFRYHPLFADYLRGQLQRTQPANLPELHRRAYAWHMDNNLKREAIGHALAAGDYELASQFITQMAETLMNRGENTILQGWLMALPDDLVRSRPQLCILHAQSLLSTNDWDAAEKRLREAESYLAAHLDAVLGGSTTTDGGPVDVRFIRGSALSIRAVIAVARGDFPLTIQLGLRALEYLSRDQQLWRDGALVCVGIAYWYSDDREKASRFLAEIGDVNSVGGLSQMAMRALGFLAASQAHQGLLHKVAETEQRALERAVEKGAQIFPAAARACLGLAQVHYEWNRLDVAWKTARQGVELANRGGLIDLLLLGHGIIARLKQAEGDLDGALETLREAEHMAQGSDVAWELGRIASYRARLWLKQGKVEDAMHWVQTLGLHADDELSYRREADHLTLAQVLVAQREPEPALRLLTRLCETAESSGRTGTVIKVLVIEALAFQAAGDRVKALEALGRALSLAEPEGYVRTFVDAGASMAVLLSRFLRGQQRKPLSSTLAPSPAYVRTLLKAFEPATSSSTGKFNGQEIAKSEANPLSERELEVLRLIASGQSVTQIARGLVVSANTVKSHLRSIYAKLDVHKNVEAVTKARVTGLLESA